MKTLLRLLGMLVVASGCATTTTQLAPASREDVRAEEVAQREHVVVELNRAQQRLDDLAYPLLVAAEPLCASSAVERAGVRLGTAADFDGVWQSAARSALGLTDTVTVLTVASASGAARAGLKAGDRILAINGSTLPVDRTASRTAVNALRGAVGGEATLHVRRDVELLDISIEMGRACGFGSVVIAEGDLNAYADGTNIIFPWAMMRFSTDDELRVIIAHEIAHNAMGHIEARKRNMRWGALLGALADATLNTGGQYTAEFMRMGAMAYSQDFEREADYVGMYILARAGLPLDQAPLLWRHIAQINPAAIAYASTHPTTAERFVRLRNAVEEIELKRRNNAELMPELKRD